MKRGRVLVLIDQALRDGLSQLLTAKYLESKGAEVVLCNQGTLYATSERFRPDVMYVSWWTNPDVEKYLRSIRHRTRIVLVDQEGGRMGEASFRRSMLCQGEAKMKLAQSATRIITWGASQAQWLTALGLDPKRIRVTGCPRLDPYMVEERPVVPGGRFFGITLRGDPLTSSIDKIMESSFHSMFRDPKDGLAPSLPLRAEYEDWMWLILSLSRHMFKVIVELSPKTKAPIVVRPGPWERYGMYKFLERRYPQVRVEPFMLQHAYVQNAIATFDASSALGLEALLAGTPVISITALMPRVEEHVGGPDGARLNSPYRGFYWQPKSMEELVELALKAERGELALTPDPEGLKRYLKDCHGWPTPKPASFQIGDLLLETLASKEAYLPEDASVREAGLPQWKRTAYRLVPGSQLWPRANLFASIRRLPAFERQGQERYHYFHSTYPHHAEMERVFARLWERFKDAPPAPPVAFLQEEKAPA